ncbi:hypothetical protein EV360DRAFT_86584 [Lentinula raphanica]|nr:hypothetical protein EV360DRAFT_86584 [Lentinula raphanica]
MLGDVRSPIVRLDVAHDGLCAIPAELAGQKNPMYGFKLQSFGQVDDKHEKSEPGIETALSTFLPLPLMFWYFPLLTLHLVLVNTLVITIPDVIVLQSNTTINFVTGSNDPSQWILRNVYANGTTQIGGTLTGNGSTTFAFQVTGPHFLQALALTKGSAASQPFYTGNLFTPVDLSTTSSTTSQSLTTVATQTIISSSCPSSETAVNSTTESPNNTGTIVGSVIGGLGFLAALIFFLLWHNMRQKYARLTQDAPSTRQIQAYHAPSATLLMTTTSYDTSEVSNPVSVSSPRRRGTMNGNEQTGGALRREVSLLRREVEELKQVHSYNVPPPIYL